MDCNQHGICTCKGNVSGKKCDQCEVGYQGHPKCDRCDPTYFGYPKCEDCGCNEKGRKFEECDQTTGDCVCNDNVDGKKCDTCKQGFFGFPDCKGNMNLVILGNITYVLFVSKSMSVY